MLCGKECRLKCVFQKTVVAAAVIITVRSSQPNTRHATSHTKHSKRTDDAEAALARREPQVGDLDFAARAVDQQVVALEVAVVF